MHFSLGDTEELVDYYGSSYVSFKIYANGTVQGRARYREFHELNEALKSEIGHVPVFPPKKLFHLSVMEINNRRQQLEKYLQNLGQMRDALMSCAFQSFLKKIALRDIPSQEEYYQEVFMLNGSSCNILASVGVNCEKAMAAVAREIGIPADQLNYFGLFLANEDETGTLRVCRKFAAFELPFAILHLNSPSNGNSSMRLVVKKSYWDPAFDAEILDSPSKVGTNLLFVETVDAIARGWLTPTPDQSRHLESLQQRGSRREFVQYARNVRGYGTVHFKTAMLDYPSPATLTKPYLNGKDLVCPLKAEKQEAVFKVTRMRCWRLCVSETYHSDGDSASKTNLSITFEYLIGRDNLQWITLVTDEAVWISACLQSIVEELLLKKRGGTPGTKSSETKPMRKGSKTEEMLQVSVVTRPAVIRNANSAFEEIGDDDL